MKSMKLTLAIAALMVAPIAINAQEKAKPVDEKTKHKKLVEKLALTEEQETKMQEINAKYEPQRKKLKAETKVLKEKLKAIKEKRKALGEAQHKEMEAILTPEQKVKFEKMIAARKEKKMEKKKNGTPSSSR